MWDTSMRALFTSHENALNLLFAELKATAEEQEEAFLGTPGTLSERVNETGTEFWVHRYSDAVGQRRETYLGKADDPKLVPVLDRWRKRIEATNATISRVRVLARAGFATVDRKTYATVAALHNHGLFSAGGFLVGSHAYGALLNGLGIRTIPYATEDVDIARGERLALPEVRPFLDLLRDSGVDFLEVPPLRRREPSTSFKEPGRSRFKVDLLVPSSGEGYPAVAVPELKAHARGLPYLHYLLAESQQLPLLSPYGVVQVRVPIPERYAIHKLVISQLRSKDSRPAKDLGQAAVLIAALVERFPGAIEDALRALPKGAAKSLWRAKAALSAHLPAAAEVAWDSLSFAG
jgi:hypothetical protein